MKVILLAGGFGTRLSELTAQSQSPWFQLVENLFFGIL